MIKAAAQRRTPEQLKEYRIKYNAQLRSDVLGAYGDRCACCGEEEPKFLSIDHIDGGGAAHRRETGVGSGFHFYLWIRRNDYPDGLQVLCHNCNSAKGSYGQCPHEEAQ